MTTKENFPGVTAELVHDEHGTAVLLTQSETGTDGDASVMLHPLQLRHIAERYAAMEPAGWTTSHQVRALAGRLRRLAFHAARLHDWFVNDSGGNLADLTYEFAMVVSLSDLAHEFCLDLPDQAEYLARLESQVRTPSTRSKDAPTAAQVSLI